MIHCVSWESLSDILENICTFIQCIDYITTKADEEPPSTEFTDNTAYVLQTGSFVEGGEVSIQLPLMVIFQKYKGDNLIVTSVEMHDLNLEIENEFVIMKSTSLKVNKYVVPQIVTGMITEDNNVIDSFKTNSVGMGFFMDNPVKQFFKPSFYTHSLDLEVSFFSRERLIVIRLHRKPQHFINEKFKEAYTSFS